MTISSMTETTERWRQVRRLVNVQRLALVAEAARLYPGAARAAGTDLLCRPEWLPDPLRSTWPG